MPVSEMMAGAALGLALQVLHDAIKRAKDRSLTTRCILDRLDATIFRITPLVAQVDKLSEEVEDSPRKVIEDLKHLLEKAVSLVEAYAELRRRNLLQKYRYKRRIKELEASLRWMVDVDVQVNQWLDIKELMAKMSEMNTKLDEITRQPSDCPCFKKKHSISESTDQNIVESLGPSSEEVDECSSDGSKPKFDIHLQWRSRKQNKDREIRFTLK
ncbi:unnamed protein product [Thlaspi arvense]|uniref:RPW8 domain-containing protein n=1 Tax=Thlaspi arvense TaxID=13288 RepID=A0AAU9SGF8_THLAR|nr:unnamed protein product [Thlaspi arvense]